MLHSDLRVAPQRDRSAILGEIPGLRVARGRPAASRRYPTDPPTVEEIVAVIRQVGGRYGRVGFEQLRPLDGRARAAAGRPAALRDQRSNARSALVRVGALAPSCEGRKFAERRGDRCLSFAIIGRWQSAHSQIVRRGRLLLAAEALATTRRRKCIRAHGRSSIGSVTACGKSTPVAGRSVAPAAASFIIRTCL
jgi:hypothetical protein